MRRVEEEDREMKEAPIITFDPAGEARCSGGRLGVGSRVEWAPV